MSKLVLGSLVLFTNLALADSLVKTCKVDIQADEIRFAATIEIFKTTQGLLANVVQVQGSYQEKVEYGEFSVREGIKIDLDSIEADGPPENFNEAELIVHHAMLLTSDPIFAGKFSAGVDLSKVRSAKLYRVGERTSMGSATVVEAMDQEGKVLGSFLGGFLVGPCL